jgi:hypothetical protein
MVPLPDDMLPDNILDQEEEMAFSKYCDKFFEKDTYQIVTIDKKHCENLMNIAKVGFVAGRVSEIFRDEYDDLLNDLKKTNVPFFDNGAFARLNYFSPKDSIFWNESLPFRSWNGLLQVIATSKRTTSSLVFSDGNEIIIRPWRYDWEQKNEYRVFVKDKKISAISQYYLYTDFGLSKLTDDQVRNIVDSISNLNDTIAKSYPLDNYVIDVQVDDKYRTELVDEDKDIIMDSTKDIHFRVTN